MEETFPYGVGHNRVELTAHVPVRSCAACSFEYYDGEAEDARHEAVCRYLGVQTPAEIETLRKSLHLSRADFADLTQLGEATIARWERGALIQNAANDSYLYLLHWRENIDRLIAMRQQGTGGVDESKALPCASSADDRGDKAMARAPDGSDSHQRELARQKHRRFAIFAMLQCWANNWTTIVAAREPVERLLGLDRFKGKRREWMKEDFEEVFPYVRVLTGEEVRPVLELMAKSRVRFAKGSDDSFQLLFLSQYPLGRERTQEDYESSLRVGALTLWDDFRHSSDSKRVEGVDKSKFQGIKFLFADGQPDERILSAHLALLAQGVIPFEVFRYTSE
jgi:transcriptional regulator with XRE-family HTH domain